MTNPLVAFSGLDGAGKSTQIALLAAHLRRQGQEPVVIWTRGGYTPLFSALKTLLRRLSGRRLVPEAGPSQQRSQTMARPAVLRLWLTLAMLDLVWIYGVRVRMERWRGRPVICDRYLWDTEIDFRLHYPQARVDRWLLWRLLVRLTPRPDAAFLMSIPLEESMRRGRLKNEPFPTPPDLLARRKEIYESSARRNSLLVLDGLQPVDQLAGEILAAIPAMPGA